jgi:hypothetical protein
VFEILNLVREFLYRILGVEYREKGDEVYLFSNALVEVVIFWGRVRWLWAYRFNSCVILHFLLWYAG